VYTCEVTVRWLFVAFIHDVHLLIIVALYSSSAADDQHVPVDVI